MFPLLLWPAKVKSKEEKEEEKHAAAAGAKVALA